MSVQACTCRDCMELTYGDSLCHECEDAGCEPNSECSKETW